MERSKTVFNNDTAENWCIIQKEYELQEDANWETLFTLSNGYMGVRGSIELSSAGRNPGTYLAGIYDKPDSVDDSGAYGIAIKNKAITPAYAIIPVANLMEITVDGSSIDLINCKILLCNRILNMNKGILQSEYQLEDIMGRITLIKTMTAVSKADVHLIVMNVEITPKNYSGQISVRFINRQSTEPQYIPRLKDYISKTDLVEMGVDEDSVYIHSRVSETGVDIGLYAQTFGANKKTVEKFENGISEVFNYYTAEGESTFFTKYISIYTSCDCGNPVEEASKSLKMNIRKGYNLLFTEHYDIWSKKWSIADVEIKGDEEAQLALRWSIFNIIQLGMEDNSDVSISATGLHGQGYFGHVFWDTEIFILPFFLATNQEIAKKLLMYRYNRLDAARDIAKEKGFKGAKYPWTSTWHGGDVTPPDWERCGSRQIHLSGDIAYAFENYLKWTGDIEFYKEYGIEVIVETAKYYASRVTQENDGKYHILDVIGPDEYNIHANDNYYTNHLVCHNIKQAVSSMQMLRDEDLPMYKIVSEKTGWNEEIELWLEQISENMAFPGTKENVNEQYSGFFELSDIGGFERDSYNMPINKEHFYDANTQVLKQPDVVMMHYLFLDDFQGEIKKASYEYYEKRCNHGSSLSPSIHCISGTRLGFSKNSYGYFLLSAYMDLKNMHLDKSLKEGIHTACIGGTWASAVYGFGGVLISNNTLHINPVMPEKWETLKFSFKFKNDLYRVYVTKQHFSIRLEGDKAAEVVVNGVKHILEPNKRVNLSCRIGR